MPRALELKAAVLLERQASRPGAEEWRVALEPGGKPGVAVAYTALVGPLRAGERVLLNTTAVALKLGTGGVHFVVARLAMDEGEAFAPEGHVLKLRYTPLQHAVRAVEEGAHAEALRACEGLAGMPVIAAELHSQMAAAAIAARAFGRPGLRIVYVMSDTAALPLAWSRLVARLHADGTLAGTITAGQAFGGDLEAVNVHSALLAARAVLDADLAIVAQGPGNAGTGTPYGFGGLAQGEHLNAAAALGGHPIAALRVSFADPRPRHHGVSHHTLTVLARVALGRCQVPLPPLPEAETKTIQGQLAAAGIPERHDIQGTDLDTDAALAALAPYRGELTTMGRLVEQDPAFFLGAAAAGVAAARLAADGSSSATGAARAIIASGGAQMTLTIDLPQELEERLRREAEKRGLTVSEYTRHLIEQQLPARREERKSLWETLTPDEWKREFRAWVDSHDATKPPLPPEALERASFYGDRG
jgi:Protein of unknown function (DUF3866)